MKKKIKLKKYRITVPVSYYGIYEVFAKGKRDALKRYEEHETTFVCTVRNEKVPYKLLVERCASVTPTARRPSKWVVSRLTK